jgi:hypothetical protein
MSKRNSGNIGTEALETAIEVDSDLEDLENYGNGEVRLIEPCSKEEESLPDGVVDTCLSTTGLTIRIKHGSQVIQIEHPANLAKIPILELINNPYFQNLELQSILAIAFERINKVLPLARPQAKSRKPRLKPDFEITVTNRDGSKKIVYATRYNIDLVMNELAMEEANRVKLGVMCDNMEQDLALREEAKTKKGLNSLNKRVYLTEKAMHEKNLARIAAGEITEKAYRKSFN